jgi:hypothetical protein
MNRRRVVVLSVLAAAASISLPALLSAQSDVAAPLAPVRITLLASGEISVSGSFVLETPNREATISGPSAERLDGLRVTDFSQGMTVEMRGFVVEAESGRVGIDETGEASFLQMTDARISPAQ